jgi:hypothetical protein
MTEEERAVETGAITRDMFNELQLEVMSLKAEVARLRGLLESSDSEDSSDG